MRPRRPTTTSVAARHCRARRRSLSRGHDLRRCCRAAHAGTPCRRVLSRAVARRALPYLSMHHLRMFAQQDSSMRHAGHMSTVCSWCAIVSRPACTEYYKFACESAARATDFIRTSTHTSTGCKEDARWSFGRRSTSIRPTAAGHTGAHMKLHIQATHIQRVRSHSRERSSGGAVLAARPRSGGASAA